MTNSIEQAKREMYQRIANMRGRHLTGNDGDQYHVHGSMITAMEDSMESYLELLRQDHEALHHTARARFEDTRKLEAANQELSAGLSKANENLMQAAIISRDSIASLEFRLAKMTEERDSIQLRLHAVDHAYKTQQDQVGTSGQVSGDRASCATPDAKTMALLGSILDVQRIVSDWAMGDSKAKASMHKIAAVVNGDLEVAKALDAFQCNEPCKPGEKDWREIAAENEERHAVMMAVAAEAKQRAEEKIGDMNAAFFRAVMGGMSATCMHSFFAIGDDPSRCIYCGEMA